MRNLLERLSRNRAFRQTLRIEGRARRLYVSPDARLSHLTGRFEDDLLDLAREQVEPGTVVWDVGANVGVFSVAAAAMGGQVVAFEADPWLAGLLRKSAALQPDPFRVLCLALSDHCGVVDFAIANRGRASNALVGFGKSQMGGVREVVTVPALTLDALLADLPAPDLVKIDVEGAEISVLSGAKDLLAHGPRLYIEFADENREEGEAMLAGFGYGPATAGPTGPDTLYAKSG